MSATTLRHGHRGRLLWIDLARQSSRWEERDDIFWRQSIGGGLLATRLLMENTPAGIDPLGPGNLLIFASSVMAGHEAAGLPRFTVAAKSPLTLGIGETRCEGPWGVALKRCGADAIIFSGQAEKPVVVFIEDERVEWVDAAPLWGMTVGEASDAIERQLGPGAHVAAIGPAGENRVRFASVVSERTFAAARLGMGAVMGAKHLKAVVLRGGRTPEAADPERVASLNDSFAQRIDANPLARWQKEPPGFSAWLTLHGVDAALCVKNYTEPGIDGIEAFQAERFLQRVRGHAPCPGCPNDCIKTLHPFGRGDLDPRASGIHQEVTGAMGPNLGIVDLDWVLAANNTTNQLGLDPTSLGFTVSFAMECFERGMLTAADGPPVRFGDDKGAQRLIGDITHRRGLGGVLAEGTRAAAERIGRGASRYAMHVKGLEMVCFEPRSQSNLALGYATAPVGPRYDICEHDWDFDTNSGWEHSLDGSRTLGILERVPGNEISHRKVAMFKALHTLWSAADALDLCIFAIAPTRLLSLSQMAQMLAAVTGWQTSSHEIMRIGERRNHIMRCYNLREGLGARDDTLPDRFFEEPIASGKRKGDVLDRARFQDAVRFYYSMMGWDSEGRPTQATLQDHGLAWLP